jgi:hypothetical protein
MQQQMTWQQARCQLRPSWSRPFTAPTCKVCVCVLHAARLAACVGFSVRAAVSHRELMHAAALLLPCCCCPIPPHRLVDRVRAGCQRHHTVCVQPGGQRLCARARWRGDLPVPPAAAQLQLSLPARLCRLHERPATGSHGEARQGQRQRCAHMGLRVHALLTVLVPLHVSCCHQ